MSGIYDAPEFYELACAYRDVKSEVDALARWYGEHRPVIYGAWCAGSGHSWRDAREVQAAVGP